MIPIRIRTAQTFRAPVDQTPSRSSNDQPARQSHWAVIGKHLARKVRVGAGEPCVCSNGDDGGHKDRGVGVKRNPFIIVRLRHEGLRVDSACDKSGQRCSFASGARGRGQRRANGVFHARQAGSNHRPTAIADIRERAAKPVPQLE